MYVICAVTIKIKESIEELLDVIVLYLIKLLLKLYLYCLLIIPPKASSFVINCFNMLYWYFNAYFLKLRNQIIEVVKIH